MAEERNEAIKPVVKDADHYYPLTALIPGKAGSVLITEEVMAESGLAPGSCAYIDVAIDQGGSSCADQTRREEIVVDGVTISGVKNIPA